MQSIASRIENRVEPIPQPFLGLISDLHLESYEFNAKARKLNRIAVRKAAPQPEWRPSRQRSPEEKAAKTVGRRLVGKITLNQYLCLVDLGLDGDVIKAWTKHHASKEIAKRTVGARIPTRSSTCKCDTAGPQNKGEVGPERATAAKLPPRVSTVTTHVAGNRVNALSVNPGEMDLTALVTTA